MKETNSNLGKDFISAKPGVLLHSGQCCSLKQNKDVYMWFNSIQNIQTLQEFTYRCSPSLAFLKGNIAQRE